MLNEKIKLFRLILFYNINFYKCIGKEYVAVLRLHEALENEKKLGQVNIINIGKLQ